MLNKVLVVWKVAVALLGLAFAGAAAAEERRLPVPAVTIRPGEVIKEEMIAERAFASNLLGVALFVEARPGLLGRMARRTLLPGQPIPINAVEDSWSVARGAAVKIVVEDNGLSIVAYGAALQSGAAGSLIPVRNVDTGVIIRGIVEPDGSVRVVDK
jgi:flagella basal body P-ring formation protein FlgA